MNNEIIDIQASTGQPTYTYGKATIHYFNKNEKVRKALKKMAMFWGASLLAILLPVVHFVLVPLLFLLGIFFFFRVMKTDGEVVSGNIVCPSCQTEATLQPDLLPCLRVHQKIKHLAQSTTESILHVTHSGSASAF